MWSLPAGHCFRGWSKINPNVYNVINCLNKNLVTHFVWYLKKEKRYDIETLSIGIKLEELFQKNKAENMHQKLDSDPFLILVNDSKQPLHARNSSKIGYFERRLSKNLKKFDLIFSFEKSNF